jgi:uncharacterized paraquat-inducible protein A
MLLSIISVSSPHARFTPPYAPEFFGTVAVIACFAVVALLLFGLWRAQGENDYQPELFRRKQHDLHLCQVCGYDLRASVGRCPECGTRFDRPSCEKPRWTAHHFCVIEKRRNGRGRKMNQRRD